MVDNLSCTQYLFLCLTVGVFTCDYKGFRWLDGTVTFLDECMRCICNGGSTFQCCRFVREFYYFSVSESYNAATYTHRPCMVNDMCGLKTTMATSENVKLVKLAWFHLHIFAELIGTEKRQAIQNPNTFVYVSSGIQTHARHSATEKSAL